jgi:hypothetical protein
MAVIPITARAAVKITAAINITTAIPRSVSFQLPAAEVAPVMPRDRASGRTDLWVCAAEISGPEISGKATGRALISQLLYGTRTVFDRNCSINLLDTVRQNCVRQNCVRQNVCSIEPMFDLYRILKAAPSSFAQIFERVVQTLNQGGLTLSALLG